jgi:hypothetical protein
MEPLVLEEMLKDAVHAAPALPAAEDDMPWLLRFPARCTGCHAMPAMHALPAPQVFDIIVQMYTIPESHQPPQQSQRVPGGGAGAPSTAAAAADEGPDRRSSDAENNRWAHGGVEIADEALERPYAAELGPRAAEYGAGAAGAGPFGAPLPLAPAPAPAPDQAKPPAPAAQEPMPAASAWGGHAAAAAAPWQPQQLASPPQHQQQPQMGGIPPVATPPGYPPQHSGLAFSVSPPPYTPADQASSTGA